MENRFQHKKKWGQNFLKDKNIVQKIVRDSKITSEDRIWEIGPGEGVLTQEILAVSDKLTVFEIDPDVIELTEDRFGDRVKIVSGDVIKANWRKYLDNPIKIVANIPYQITSPLLYKVCNFSDKIESVTIMVQKEFADRLRAVPNTKQYSAMTIKTQFFYNISMLFKVPSHLFFPPPRVDSAVIHLERRDDIPQIEHLFLFNRMIDAAFSMRRKTLRNNFKPFLGKENLKKLEQENIIDLRRRGETLSEEEYLNLYSYIVNTLKITK